MLTRTSGAAEVAIVRQIDQELERIGEELATARTQTEIASTVAGCLRDGLALDDAALLLGEETEGPWLLRQAVSFRGERLALLCCGPKSSGAPFSEAEQDLVKGVAVQTSLALHNVRTMAELGKAQADLTRSERLAAVGRFAGAVAHGIRNPLAGIRAAAQVAQSELDDGSPASDSLHRLVGEADRLEQRIRNLLNYSRPYELSRRPVRLEALLQDVEGAIRGTGQRAGVTLTIRCRDPKLEWPLDRDFFEEALLELAVMSIHAMPEGGKAHMEAWSEDRALVVQVRDTGPGIAADVLERVFEPFYTTRLEGSGIGLANVKKIVEAHGGEIEAEASDVGACFVIRIR